MRDYGRVYTAFWTSEDVRSLTDDGRLLALYLLTSPHSTIAGVFRLPNGYASDDLQWGTERVADGFSELIAKGFADRCETTKWVWIRRFLDWNAPEGPNQWKAARKVAALVPNECRWKAEFSRVFALAAGDPPPPAPHPPANSSETPPDGGARPHQEPIANPAETPSDSGTGTEGEIGTGTKRSSSCPTDATGVGGTAVAPLVRGAQQGELLNGCGPEPVAAKSAGGPVDRVFAHWRQGFGHPKAVLDSKRRRVIAAALATYSEADLCHAIDGYRNSPHHMGHNDRATVYDDVALFLRDAQHIDAGLRFATQRPRADLTTVTRGNIAAAQEAKRRLFGGAK